MCVPREVTAAAVSLVTGSWQRKLPGRNPQLLSRICIHPNPSTVQGAAGIVPLDGAIAKELGFVYHTRVGVARGQQVNPGHPCPGLML